MKEKLKHRDCMKFGEALETQRTAKRPLSKIFQRFCDFTELHPPSMVNTLPRSQT
jgi:hypothetical protein